MSKGDRAEKAVGGAATAASPADDRAAKTRNLLQRVATAVVLLPIVLWLIWMGGLPFATLLGIAALLNAVELHSMALRDDPLRIVSAFSALAMPFFFVMPELGEAHLHWLYAFTVIIALTWRLLRDAPVDTAGRDVSITVFAAAYGSLLGYLMPLRQLGGAESNWGGAGWVVLACALTWVGDTAAYFTGRAIGKNKLYPRISPAKTWEGFFGGMLDRVDALMVNAPIVYFYAKTFTLARGE